VNIVDRSTPTASIPFSNRVVVGIKPYTEQSAGSLRARFGPEIKVVEHDLDVYP
jgi:hypothetical protein